MKYLRNLTVLAVLALFAASGCSDLTVPNPNAADRSRALATPGDVESLVSGSFHTWWTATHNAFANDGGPLFFLSAASFQHSCWPANAGCVEYSSFPRGQIVNSSSDAYYGMVAGVWNESYAALAAVSKGLRALENDPSVAEGIDAQRLRAFGKLMQGIAHGSIAVLYDQGFLVDESVDTDDPNADPELLAYNELMTRAMGYFDEAISLSEGASFTIPTEWMSTAAPVDAGTLAALAHTLKARYMASVARTPSERGAVDWNAVMTELDAGLQQGFELQMQGYYDYNLFTTDVLGYWIAPAWQQLNYYVLGMADTSGAYQNEWLSQPVSSRVPDPNDTPILIETPDTRFPQGTTLGEQRENLGEYYVVPGGDPTPDDATDNDPTVTSTCTSAQFSLANNFQQPSRGTWRWSYYFDGALLGCNGEGLGPRAWAMITQAEIDLLRAEAHIRLSQPGMAASIIDQYRTAHGLDASGDGNDTCVPRLPDGTCGDLMEMMKWEKRLEARYRGLHANGWYFDGRGWGDLYQGTFRHFPIPEEDLLTLGMSPYTTGTQGSGTSVYQWPGE